MNFHVRSSKNIQIPNCTKICLVGDEVLRADRQTDMMKLKVAFRNFTNAPKHGILRREQRRLCSTSPYIIGGGTHNQTFII